MDKPRILLIDDEEMITELIKEILSDFYDIECVNSSILGAEKTKEGAYNVVLSDLKMPGLDGIGVLRKVKEYSPKTDVIIMTGFATIDSAVEAIKFGAFDYITKPFEIDYLRQKIDNCLKKQKLNEEVDNLKDIKSSMVTVMKSDNKVLGVISINSLKSADYFNDRALKIFSIFANNAAFAIKEAKNYDRMKELDRLKSEFVSSVSHELKTPLTSISASIEMIEGGYAGDITPNVKHFMDIIRNNSNRLVGLVNDVLDFSRADAGVMNITKVPIGITGLVKAVVDELAPLAEQKGLSMIAEVMPNEVILQGDANRIKQVVVNLVGNALKFCSTGRIFVGVSEKETEVKMWIKDEGPGIPEDKQSRIFEKFFRADNGLRRETAGFGIGLALSKGIVEAHGGKIWFESAIGKGTAFYFTLPKGGNNG